MIKFLLLVLTMVISAESFLELKGVESDLPLPSKSPDYTMTRNYETSYKF